jgi:hypothetical protein
MSHAQSDNLIKNDEDKKFLELLRQGRIGLFGSVDKKLADRKRQ